MTLIPTKFEMFDTDRLRRPANLYAFLFFVVILVPQATLVGRPWLVSATFGMWFLCSLGPQLTDTIKRAGPLAILPLITLLITFHKMHTSGGEMGLHMPFVAGPIYLSLTTFLCCFYLLHFPRVLQQIRILSVIVLSVFIAYGLSIAYAEPGVGRILAMQKSVVLGCGFDPDALTLRGVPGYGIIYTTAMVGLLLVSWWRDAKCFLRQAFILYVAALIVLLAHVVLSTLTLAVFVGGIVFVSGLLLHLWLSRIRYRITIMCGIVLMAVALSPLEHIQFVAAKTSRLVTGMASQGLEDGDETGRGGRMINSFNTFCEHPLWGCEFSPEVLQEKIGDHSSLIDPLGMYGIFGYMPMILYQFIIIRNGLRTWKINRRNLRGIGEAGAWVFYVVCSFWNTTTYTVLPLSLLFLQLVPPLNSDSCNVNADVDVSSGDNNSELP